MANEKRTRSNFGGGLIEDNPLTSSATTLTSAGLASLPVVDTTNHLVITLDPDGYGGAPEIIYVLAHASTASTATILRGQESTTARQHERDTPWVHSVTTLDFFEPWLVDIIGAASEPSATVGTWAIALWSDATYPFGGTGIQSVTGAQNDSITWTFAASAGLWTISLLTRRSTNVGIYNVQVDGVSIGTYDGYAAASYGKATFAGVALTAGVHTIKLLMATKNASSSGTGYNANVFGLNLRRTV